MAYLLPPRTFNSCSVELRRAAFPDQIHPLFLFLLTENVTSARFPALHSQRAAPDLRTFIRLVTLRLILKVSITYLLPYISRFIHLRNLREASLLVEGSQSTYFWVSRLQCFPISIQVDLPLQVFRIQLRLASRYPCLQTASVLQSSTRLAQSRYLPNHHWPESFWVSSPSAVAGHLSPSIGYPRLKSSRSQRSTRPSHHLSSLWHPQVILVRIQEYLVCELR